MQTCNFSLSFLCTWQNKTYEKNMHKINSVKFSESIDKRSILNQHKS